MNKVFLSLLFVFCVGYTKAQITPYTWTFTIKKIDGKTYEVHCTADVQAPWHTYSQFTPAGGPVPTKFRFVKNPLYSLDGIVKEEGKLVVKHEDVFGVDVKYFEGKADFIQRVKMRGTAKTNFSGSVEFMVCNDRECLPPTTQKFSVVLNQ